MNLPHGVPRAQGAKLVMCDCSCDAVTDVQSAAQSGVQPAVQSSVHQLRSWHCSGDVRSAATSSMALHFAQPVETGGGRTVKTQPVLARNFFFDTVVVEWPGYVLR